MKCKSCGFCGHPKRTIVLTADILTNDKGVPLKKYLKNRTMPFSNFKEWALSEAETQGVEILRCSKCDAEFSLQEL